MEKSIVTISSLPADVVATRRQQLSHTDGMSAEPGSSPMPTAYPRGVMTVRRDIILITGLILLLLLPFLGKAFHIDDPLFIRTARHILFSPADPYGFSVN